VNLAPILELLLDMLPMGINRLWATGIPDTASGCILHQRSSVYCIFVLWFSSLSNPACTVLVERIY